MYDGDSPMGQQLAQMLSLLGGGPLDKEMLDRMQVAADMARSLSGQFTPQSQERALRGPRDTTLQSQDRTLRGPQGTTTQSQDRTLRGPQDFTPQSQDRALRGPQDFTPQSQDRALRGPQGTTTQGPPFGADSDGFSRLRAAIQELDDRYRVPFLMLLRIVEIQRMAEACKASSGSGAVWKRDMLESILRTTKDPKARLRLELLSLAISAEGQDPL